MSPQAHQVRRCWRRGRRGRDRRHSDRQLEFQQRRVRQPELGADGAIGPGPAGRSGPAELESRDGNDHHGSGGGQGQGRCGCQVPGGDRQPCAEAERRLVRRPPDSHPSSAPRLRQYGLQGHRCPVGRRRSDFKNAAQFCKAEREYMGGSALAQKYGTNRNGANAFGKCMSADSGV
jgi:hypothetical protein